MSAPLGSEVSRAVCLRYVMRDPVAFRAYWTPKATKRGFQWRYYFTPTVLGLDGGDAALYAGRGGGKCANRTNTIVHDSTTGEAHVLGDMIDRGTGTHVASVVKGGVQPVPIGARMDSGVQACWRVTLASGRWVELTASHLLLTADGWRPVSALGPGDTIAVPRRLPCPESPVEIADHDVDLLAVMLADGGLTGSAVHVTKHDPAIIGLMRRAAEAHGCEVRGRRPQYRMVDPRATRRHQNRIRVVLASYGVGREKSRDKTVPPIIFRLGRRLLAQFLSVFWMCDGYVDLPRGPGITLASETMLRQIQHLLLRFGIQSVLRPKPSRNQTGRTFPAWCLTPYAASWPTMATTLTLWGEKARRLEALVAQGGNVNTGTFPVISAALEARLRQEKIARPYGVTVEERKPGWFWKGLKTRPDGRVTLSLSRLRRWAHAVGVADEYPVLMNEDLWWDPIRSIEAIGMAPTGDLTVPPSENFVANDIVVHNSIGVLEPELVRHAIARAGEETVLTAFRKIHIRDRMERMIDYIVGIPFFRQFFYSRIVRSPVYEVRLQNGHITYGIPVGEDVEAKQSQGKHASLLAIEEAHQYAERAYMKLNGARDPRGSRMLMIGVPDGRLETPFRLADTEYDSFKGRRFHVSRRHDPYWDRATAAHAVDLYGSEDSDLFGQEVDAIWGSPAWSAWNLDHIYASCDEKILPMEPTGESGWYVHCLEIHGRSYRERELTPESSCLSLPGRKWAEGQIRLAADIGYTQPTEIGVFQKNDLFWYLIARISLTGRMEHDDQAAIFDHLGQIYQAAQIAIDATDGEGRAIARELEQMPRWAARITGDQVVSPIVRVVFNENTVYDYTRNASGDLVALEDLVKYVAVRKLRNMFARRDLIIARDEDLIAEFNQEREMKLRDGMLVIRTPATVHIPEMLRVFATVLVRDNPPVPPSDDQLDGGDEFALATGDAPWESGVSDEFSGRLWGG